jgi:multicomponent Na+:H+ antiporter subunit E
MTGLELPENTVHDAKQWREPLSTSVGTLLRLGVFALLWWALTGGNGASWIIGAPVILLATWLSASFAGIGRVRLSATGLARYLVFFLIESIRGGVDVARRALLPGTHIDPHFLHYRTGLAEGIERDMLVYTISLLPGTLAVDIEDDRLIVHALSHDLQPLDSVRNSERYVAAVFRESPAPAGVLK